MNNLANLFVLLTFILFQCQPVESHHPIKIINIDSLLNDSTYMNVLPIQPNGEWCEPDCCKMFYSKSDQRTLHTSTCTFFGNKFDGNRDNGY